MDLGPPPYEPVPEGKKPTKHRFPFALLLTSLVITTLAASTIVLGIANIQMQKEIQRLSSPHTQPPVPTGIITPTQSETQTLICGGIAGKTCPEGYTCHMSATYPDASGTCTKTNSYTCPPSGYVDCMPILDDTKKKACAPEAMSWYKTNCPTFKGAAL